MIKTRDPKEIWQQLKSYMDKTCNTERCWLNQSFMNKSEDAELLNYTFAPNSPKSWKTTPDEWLSSLDIENVMKQYEHAYPCFQFLGPSPIDFDIKKGGGGKCVWNELCKFDMKKCLMDGHNKMGFIFNTDPHYLSGSHWIALFVNLKKKYVYFFDSVGDAAPKEINTLIDRIIGQGKDNDIELKRYDNKVRHQRSNTECGMYCLYVIINALKDIHPFEKMSQRIPDEEMKRFREIYFNPIE